jgi:glycosyltransferase involved in cell wall biosynthesis
MTHISGPFAPVLSVVIPTFNNEAVLRRAVDSWRTHAEGQLVELVVVEDGCRDGTRRFLDDVSATEWGQAHLRFIHMDDAHELRCTNAGFAAARGQLLAAWQDDMFLKVDWLVGELIALFERDPDVGQLGLSRGLNMYPAEEPIERWDDLLDRFLAGHPIGRIVAGGAMKFGWQRLNAEYAKQFGIEATNPHSTT